MTTTDRNRDDLDLGPGHTNAAAAGSSALPRLPAVTADWISDALTVHAAVLHELADGLGGPYHAVNPAQFNANAGAFRAVLDQAGVAGRVYYAKKANKAACWVRQAAELGVGVDVASVAELRDALGHGVIGERLVVTGPAKSDDLLRLAILHGSLVAIDALDELERFITLAGWLGPGRLLLRVLPPQQPTSRFGLDETQLEQAIGRCRDELPTVRLEGFSFHLSGYGIQPRADLAGQLIGLCERARSLGLPADKVSIGGGFAVNYLAAEHWAGFTADPAHFHAEKRFADFYPYHSPVAGPDSLRAILAGRPAGHPDTVATALRRAGVQLLLEPGRALLDQAGFTVFRVQGVKDRGHGIVTVDGTSLSLSEQWFDSEFLPDPVLLARTPRHDPAPFPACVGAATCLESDMLTWRKVVLPTRPRAGDLLVYLNTAGYQMDSNESPFHGLRLPPKVILSPEATTLRWRLDGSGC